MRAASCYVQDAPLGTELMIDNMATNGFFALVMHHQHTVSSEVSPLGAVDEVRHDGHPEHVYADKELNSVQRVRLQGMGMRDLAAGTSVGNTTSTGTCRKDANPRPISILGLTSWETFIHDAERPISPAPIHVS